MSTSIDKSWMSKPRTSPEYISGVASFIDFTHKANKGVTLFSCPCLNCRNGRGKIPLEEIDYHLLRHGIDQSYTVWFVHGENIVQNEEPRVGINFGEVDNGDDGGVDLVNDAFRRIGDNADAFMEDIRNGHDHNHVDNTESEFNVDRDAKKYKSLLDDAKKPLYPSCTRNQTKLLSTIELYNAKVRHGLSDSSFDDILQIVKSLLPDDNTLPDTTHKAKKMIRALGMDYEVIHACPNDCILYWKTNEKLQSCPVCHASRWIPRYLKRDHPSKVPEKVLRYFPIIPRLQRLYSVPWIAEAMQWHAKTTPSKEVMRHPVDSPVWSRINSLWPDFALEDRNVRLGLATDGFNPFGHLSSTYSCWPVIIVPYNLPPSYCMRKEFSILSLLIPGPRGPGKDIDVYLQPLIHDLKTLWNSGVSTYDSITKLPFTLRAILMWTIHDFPAYGSLSGCITHGKYACPVCAEETVAERLESAMKFTYQAHRRGLLPNHEFRTQTTPFNNKEEHRQLPRRMTGFEVKEKVASIHMEFGKSNGTKRKRSEAVAITAWYKNSILFTLPYWGDLTFRHNLDVMHIEKNVSEHLLSTILEIKNKTKDGERAREDLKRMKIKKNLWLGQEGGKVIKPTAPFTLNNEEKRIFCQTLHDLKVPKGYSSNWRLRVNMERLEIKGLKSHDHHIIMQQLFPVLLQHAFSKHKTLRKAVQDICTFYKVLCAKELRVDDLVVAKYRLIEAMCVLEKFFPPSFFDISIHLMIHLADEALACGPVWFRWMYYFERLLKVYKGYVKNMARPEGCIAERYVVEESILYCMEYVPNGDRGNHKHSRQELFNEGGEIFSEGPLSKGKVVNLTNVQFEQVRKWVLESYDGVEAWKRSYEKYLNSSSFKGAKKRGGQPKPKPLDFIPWLRKELEHVDGEMMLKRLADGPTFKAKSYKKYRVNGFMFSPSNAEIHKTTQNSGVSMKAFTSYRASAKDKNYREVETTYYGVVRQILELDYTDFQETVFYCDWVRVEDKVNGCVVDSDTNLIRVNMEKFKGKDKEADEPFILASQAKQVFYSNDRTRPGWSTILFAPKTLTKDVDALEIPC